MLYIVTVIEKHSASIAYANIVSSREAGIILCDAIEKLLDRKFFRIQITESDPEILTSILADLTL